MKFTEVNQLDRRDLMMWGVDVQDKAFLEDYSEERTFWAAGGKRGGMEPAILYLLAKKHRKVETPAEAPAEPTKTTQPKKVPQPA